MINLLLLQYCQPLTLSKGMSQAPKAQRVLNGVSLSVCKYVYLYKHRLFDIPFGISNQGFILKLSNFLHETKGT